jgi:hypothetical protein
MSNQAGSSARFKPNAQRLEISLPLDAESDNYREQQDEQKCIKTLELRYDHLITTVQ